jgi:hypothetical protein
MVMLERVVESSEMWAYLAASLTFERMDARLPHTLDALHARGMPGIQLLHRISAVPQRFAGE